MKNKADCVDDWNIKAKIRKEGTNLRLAKRPLACYRSGQQIGRQGSFLSPGPVCVC